MVREELGAVGCLSFKHKFDKIRFINNNIKIKLYFEINKDRYSFQENIKIKCGYLFIFNLKYLRRYLRSLLFFEGNILINDPCLILLFISKA